MDLRLFVQKKAASLFPTSRVRDVAGFVLARDRGGLDSTRCNGKIGRCNGRKTRYSRGITVMYLLLVHKV
jgi:hypothetical protein